MNKERIIIVMLLLLLVWFGNTIVRLESYHYANQVGFCLEYNFPEQGIQKDDCLNEKETRVSFIWHLVYALNIL
jgi:hypothetical protein